MAKLVKWCNENKEPKKESKAKKKKIKESMENKI